MKRLIIKCISLTAIIGLISLSSEGWAASKEDARAMAKRVEAYIKTNGKAKAILEVQKDNGIFEKGEIYIYIFDFNATIIAHPKLPTWVGKSFLNLKDTDGKLFIKEAVEQLKTKDECWIQYKWNNPETKKIGLKHGFFLKVSDMILVSGVWD